MTGNVATVGVGESDGDTFCGNIILSGQQTFIHVIGGMEVSRMYSLLL